MSSDSCLSSADVQGLTAEPSGNASKGVEPGWRQRVRHWHQLFSMAFLDPRDLARRCRALPHFARNWRDYERARTEGAFRVSLGDVLFTSYDRFGAAGSLRGHYFLQDLWAAREVIARAPGLHVDVGSRIDGFVAHILPSVSVAYVDVRALEMEVEGLLGVQGSIVELPFADRSVHSLSCLHVLEHIGLGRYGDPVDPNGHERAAAELARTVAPGGTLLVGTPVGRERLCFDAHRVFDPDTVTAMFGDLELASFWLIPDSGDRVIADATPEQGRSCEFGCGLYRFIRR
jgi:SAM-dependent methyltransferase